ncbi:MAG: 16S rRNA processing protein RimM [bacterium]|nr:MAG: 16S rRNA processing protein RimM [bacterium]KAF0147860.1 MAG: 16S rRNA processing protein RimM [bacterium]KAF0167461.1 MAG: 16S rRNA processing protein RimM [bacterium]TXT21003.1 MAG: 16S rRNA processing protein RimM [bacterium]
MGRIVAPYAVRGWVRLRTYTEYQDSLLDYEVWRIGRDGDWRDYRLLDGRIHGQSLVASLEGVHDRSAAEALMGLDVAVPRGAMPEADEDEYYWDDLIGLQVVNLAGQTLGRVEGLLETGANDVLQVRDAERERLIPFVEAVVKEVDLEAGRLLVDWGLDY